ncbi:hypothetical protein [Leuconostoc gelidum]|uniref:hypothetical protein n=1 Tax=Leuconostoc gelidum TaxID=1244 RepID=UPI001C7DABD4|nr:hypothetical protein [Leuconostoc gelidum]MBZ6010117.1 hypothetical protein [Leuconostoc gelidum subsp. aenigmaticum]
MRLFYRDILSLIEMQASPRGYSYTFTNPDTLFLTLNFDGHKTNKSQSGLYHFALLFPDAASLANLIERLILIDYPLGAGDPNFNEAFYLNDPNGNSIELYHDRPEVVWEWDNSFVKINTKDVIVQTLL